MWIETWHGKPTQSDVARGETGNALIKPQSGSEEAQQRCAHLYYSRLHGYLLLSSSLVLFENLFPSNVDDNRANTP